MLFSNLKDSESEHKAAVTSQTVIDMLSVKVTNLIFECQAEFVDGSICLSLVSRELTQKRYETIKEQALLLTLILCGSVDEDVSNKCGKGL